MLSSRGTVHRFAQDKLRDEGPQQLRRGRKRNALQPVLNRREAPTMFNERNFKKSL